MNPQYPEEKGEEVDTEIRASDRAAFRDLISKPLRPERLEGFAGVSSVRSKIVEKAVWGQIHWLKGFGRPTSTRLADGLDIKHLNHVFDEVAVDDPDFNVDIWLVGEYPISKWDLEDDVNFYVAFRSALRDGVNKVEVRFADNVPWKRPDGLPGRGIRLITPPERVFNTKEAPTTKAIYLDFEVTFF